MGNAVARVARDMDIPLVLTHHFGRRTEPGKSLVELCVLPSTRRMAAVSLGVAGETSSVLKGAVYIGNGVDTRYFDPDAVSDLEFRRKYPQTEGKKVILDVARISKTKDQLDLLEAYLQLPEEARRSTVLVFVGGVQPGEEGYLRKLENRAAELGVSDGVVITGNMSAAGVRQAYKRADVVVLASRMEGTPRTVLEAGAMKKTVIATDVGGTHEAVIEGVTGHLVRPNDPAALAKRVGDVLASPEGAARMGEAARRHVERYFSMDGLAERHLRVYSKVLRGGEADSVKAG